MKLYRPLKLFGTLGLIFLAAGAAGAIFAVGGNGTKAGLKDSPAEPARPAASVVIYGNVDVEPGVMALYPVQPSRVLEVLVRENQTVGKDKVLLRFDDRLARARLDEAEADLADAQAQLRQAEKAPDQHRLKKAQQQAAIGALEHDLAAARHAYNRKKELLDSKPPLINSHEVNAALELVKKVESALQAERAKLAELELLIPDLARTRAESLVAAKRAQRDKVQLAVDECTLKAPSDGEILQVLVGPGSVLTGHPQQPALFFAPAGPRIVRAEIEQEFANRIAVGQPVVVEDEYGRGTRRQGKVARVADWYTRPRSAALDPTRLLSSEVRTLECIIALDPTQPPFRLGQRVRVSAGRSLDDSP